MKLQVIACSYILEFLLAPTIVRFFLDLIPFVMYHNQLMTEAQLHVLASAKPGSL